MSRPPLPARVRRISPELHSCFFGYYDVPAVDPSGRRHLVHRVAFRDRLPTARDPAELGWIESDRPGEIVTFATSHAWNFQQGAGLQWLGDGSSRIFYNHVRPDGTGYHGVLHDANARSHETTDRALAALSGDGRWGLGINFDRLYDFRPGYGYAATPDPHRDELHPADDGIWLCDLQSGRSELVLSLAQLHRLLAPLVSAFVGKLLVNHVSFNPTGERFLALIRNFPAPDAPERPGGRWTTALLTANRDGTEVRILVVGYASHYHWRDTTTIACHCDGPAGVQLYELTDTPAPAFHALDPLFFERDGHVSYGPDRQQLLYDGYPDADGRQPLYVYNRGTRRAVSLGSFAALPVPLHDLRCDLHPRWIGGRAVSFDSTHGGQRSIYVIDDAGA